MIIYFEWSCWPSNVLLRYAQSDSIPKQPGIEMPFIEASDDVNNLFDLIEFFGLFCTVILLIYCLQALARKEFIKVLFCFFPSAISEPKQRKSTGNTNSSLVRVSFVLSILLTTAKIINSLPSSYLWWIHQISLPQWSPLITTRSPLSHLRLGCVSVTQYKGQYLWFIFEVMLAGKTSFNLHNRHSKITIIIDTTGYLDSQWCTNETLI